MFPPSNYMILERTNERIVIRDIGPWNQYMSVTNNAENVVRELAPSSTQRIFYYDSEGELDELVHEDGVFQRFAPGPRP
jgi:hypothetical protein